MHSKSRIQYADFSTCTYETDGICFLHHCNFLQCSVTSAKISADTSFHDHEESFCKYILRAATTVTQVCISSH